MGCNEGCRDGCEVGCIVNKVGVTVIVNDGSYVGMVVGIADGLIELGSVDGLFVEGTVVIGLEGINVTDGKLVGAILIGELDGTIDGFGEGGEVGIIVNVTVGTALDGTHEGGQVGETLGIEGLAEGATVGDFVGLKVATIDGTKEGGPVAPNDGENVEDRKVGVSEIY